MSVAQRECVAVAEVESFVERCMRSVGTDAQHSKALAQVLSAADVRGHFTHGLHRLGETYCRKKQIHYNHAGPQELPAAINCLNFFS